MGNSIIMFIRQNSHQINSVLPWRSSLLFPASNFSINLQKLFRYEVKFENKKPGTKENIWNVKLSQFSDFLFYKLIYRVAQNFTSYGAQIWSKWDKFGVSLSVWRVAGIPVSIYFQFALELREIPDLWIIFPFSRSAFRISQENYPLQNTRPGTGIPGTWVSGYPDLKP